MGRRPIIYPPTRCPRDNPQICRMSAWCLHEAEREMSSREREVYISSVFLLFSSFSPSSSALSLPTTKSRIGSARCTFLPPFSPRPLLLQLPLMALPPLSSHKLLGPSPSQLLSRSLLVLPLMVACADSSVAVCFRLPCLSCF